MILILIALLVVVIGGCWVHTKWNDYNFFAGFFAPVFAAFGFVGLLFYAVIAFDYFAAEDKANIINREYGTSYTQLEVFYASDVINTVRELDRKRIEINGDLVTGK